ncbi:MAG: hypothetical protein ACYC61_05430 [Isosphaeraceae bacterium]
MESTRRLIDYYLPPGEGFVLESLIATTYQVDFEFLEEELLAAALGVRAPVSRLKAFRSDLERRLQKAEVSVLYDLGGCERLARLSPRIDAIPVAARKLHSKISLLMWVRDGRSTGPSPDRRIRLIVGSANLTRQGFRHNYECVAAVDFGGRVTSPLALLVKAIGLIRQMGTEPLPSQLARQLASFERQAARLAEGAGAPDDPVALVAAEEVVPSLTEAWAALSDEPPDKVTVVSPFWAEGSTAPEAIAGLVRRLGDPATVELVCRGERSAGAGRWLPVFDAGIAVELKRRLRGRLYLRATLPDPALPDGSRAETGDESEEAELASRLGAAREGAEEAQRSLHAKLILLDGRVGSVLYVGSSNCTRRGLGLGGPANHEAGFVYRIPPRLRKRIEGLLSFAGPPLEVLADAPPATFPPPTAEPTAVPTFLAEIVAAGTVVTIRFREAIPGDVVLLMPIPTRAGNTGYWVLYRADGTMGAPDRPVEVDLTACPRCDEVLGPLAPEVPDQPVLPHVFVEVRWSTHTATFPVRFDDKARLPLLLIGRKPTEGELIDYFLFGKEPDEWDDRSSLPDEAAPGARPDEPIDTRRILAYFIRRFVQAIPGIEAEISRAAYSRAALDAALRGPTSPLELAEHAFRSLTRPPAADEPRKTPVAVGFQLAEILAALRRCEAAVVDPDLRPCFGPVIARCRELLDTLVSGQPDLRTGAFPNYVARITGGDR